MNIDVDTVIRVLRQYANTSHWTTTPRTVAIWNPKRDPNITDQPWTLAQKVLKQLYEKESI